MSSCMGLGLPIPWNVFLPQQEVHEQETCLIAALPQNMTGHEHLRQCSALLSWDSQPPALHSDAWILPSLCRFLHFWSLPCFGLWSLCILYWCQTLGVGRAPGPQVPYFAQRLSTCMTVQTLQFLLCSTSMKAANLGSPWGPLPAFSSFLDLASHFWLCLLEETPSPKFPLPTSQVHFLGPGLISIEASWL